jgi:hypothetical protein
VAVGEEVGRRSVDQLEPLLGEAFPVVGGCTLSHDPAGDRGELIVDVLHVAVVDLPPDFPHGVVATVLCEEVLDVGRHATALPGHGPQRTS